MTDKVLLVVLEDGETYGGAENSRIVEIPDDLYLDEYEGWDQVPVEQYRELTTIGELLAIVKRLVIAGGQIITADSPDHTVTPTDEDWREFEVALDAAAVLTGEDPWFGQCDYCDTTYEVASATDHCPEEGLCWKHCTDRGAHEKPLTIIGYANPDGTGRGNWSEVEA